MAIPFILLAFVVDFLKNGWIQLRGYWVKILLLPVIHFLSKFPVLDKICDGWWERVADSAARYYPRYKDRVRKLLGRDNPDDRELDQDIYYLFDKRFRNFMESGRLGSTQEDSEDLEEDVSDY